jgi:hypothetical protein
MIKRQRPRLTKKEFFDVYGISLLTKNNKTLINKLFPRLLEVAKKYIDITDYAIRCELRHIGKYSEIKNRKQIYKDRLNLSLIEVIKAFNSRAWHAEYGGEMWKDIAKGLLNLRDAYSRRNFFEILARIDYLNDLEHNNALYLGDFSTFYLREALDLKEFADPDEIFKRCSQEIKTTSNISHSLVAMFHTRDEDEEDEYTNSDNRPI